MPTYIWDSTLKQLVPKPPKGSRVPDAAIILRSPEAYVSPIDGTVIDDRGKLREHNKRHGVTDVRDYGDDWFKSQGKKKQAELRGATRQDKQERIEVLKRELDRRGIY